MKLKSLNFKTILLSIIFILTCFCLCGCAEVNFVTYHNSDGSINEYVYLTINEQKLIKNGYNIDAVKFEIQTNSYNEAKALLNIYQSKIYNEYVNENIHNNEYITLYNGVKIIEENWKDGKYLIGLQYKDSSIYKKYYTLVNNINFTDNSKVIKKTFYTKTYYYGTTNYGDFTIFNRIYNYYANSAFATFSPEQTSLKYSYSVSTKRFHSDADKVIADSNGNYIHTWTVSPNQTSRQICFYTITANRSVWIITCVGISLGITTLLCSAGVIHMLKKKNSQPPQSIINTEKESPNNNKNIDNN